VAATGGRSGRPRRDQAGGTTSSRSSGECRALPRAQREQPGFPRPVGLRPGDRGSSPEKDSASLRRKGLGMSLALEVSAARADSSQGAAVTRVIAFANQKGGVAKTTSTLNLGVALSEQGSRVLAVDLDPQGNLTMSQGLNPDAIERSMYDVLVHRLP